MYDPETGRHPDKLCVNVLIADASDGGGDPAPKQLDVKRVILAAGRSPWRRALGTTAASVLVGQVLVLRGPWLAHEHGVSGPWQPRGGSAERRLLALRAAVCHVLEHRVRRAVPSAGCETGLLHGAAPGRTLSSRVPAYRHLAELCRAEYPRIVTYAVWIMMELVIIGCDIQEVLGTAIALQILFGLPLWIGCLITALDTFTFLAVDRRGANQSNRYLETFFMGLIGIMCTCFFVDFTVSKPSGIEIAKGIAIPRIDNQNVMQAVGMLGSIIMPHNVYLHSALVQSRRVHSRRGGGAGPVKEANFYFGLEAVLALFVSFLINMFVISAFASTFYSEQCDALGANAASDVYNAGIQTACIPSAAALVSGNDIYIAATGLTCAIENGAVAASCTQCYTTKHIVGYCQQVGLKEAGEAVSSSLGHYAKIIWAVGLVASGQASTMTGTYAGQFVMEGFLDLRIAAWKRVAITRTMALGPALVVALLTEYDGFHSDIVSEMINVMQSVQLPFALVPLLTFTTNKRLMGQAFVYNRWVVIALVVGTLALFGVNYALVFRTLQQSFDLSSKGCTVIAVVASFYGALVLYFMAFPFVSWYKSKRQNVENLQQQETEAANQPMLA